MQGYLKLVAPLTNLLRKDNQWTWSTACQQAFDGVKHALTNAPVLSLQDFSQPFEVVTDASGFGIGAVLQQHGRPIAFYSRKLKPTEQRYSVSQKELLAVYDAMRTWRCYLEGVKGVVFTTDHKSNTFLPTQNTLSSMQAKWSDYLSKFDFHIQYKPGTTNVADPLSRSPALLSAMLTRRQKREALCDKMQAHQPVEWGAVERPAQDRCAQRMSLPTPPKATETADQPSPPLSPLEPPAHTAQTADSTADGAEEEPTATEATTRPPPTSTPSLQLNDEASAQILQGYATDAWFTPSQPRHTEKLERRGDFWYLRGALVIPDLPDLKHQIMFEFHDILISGHVGTEKTRRAILRHYWWPEIRKDVEHYVLTCESCERNKAANQLPAGQLQPLQIPERRWSSVSLDFIMQLPKTRKGHDAILVVVDRLSKMVHIIPTTTSATGEVTAQLFFDHVFKLHGAPDEIICDRDPRFSGKFMTALVEIVQIHRRISTAYHPQTDGQTERSNRILEDMLRLYVSPAQDDWDDYLSAIEFAINDSWQESIRTTPFMLNFGQHSRLGMRISNES